MAVNRKSRAKGVRGPELRQFRHAVSILKSKGLVSKYKDARSQKPTRYMRAKVKALEPVIQGKLAPVLRSRKIAKEYKEAGFTVVNRRVLLEPKTAHKVRATKQKPGEYLTIRRYVGADGETVIEQVILPATIRNFDDFVAAIRAGKFRDLKRPEDYWAFQFYGNNSQATFQTLELMLEWLDHYKALQEDEPGAWEHFVLYRVYPPGSWDPHGGPSQEKRRRHRPSKTVQDRRLAKPGKRQSRANLTYDELLAIDRKRKREARDRESPKSKELRIIKNRTQMRTARAAMYKARGGKKRPNYGNRK